MGDKWVKLIMNDKTIVLNEEIERLQFLDFEEEDAKISTNTQEIQGTDGVLVGDSTFEPFKLSLRFAYVGYDVKDYHLFKTRLKNIIYTRKPFYVVHSDYPGRKYAVIPESLSFDDKYSNSGELTIDFSVFKGYSESLKETNSFSLVSEDWQFEDGVLSDSNIKYNHNTSGFQIYNGSTDTIDPVLRHKLRIDININAPNGFKIYNKTTGDVFEYKKPIKRTNQLTLNGVHPIIDNKRVGIDTNWEWITLHPGFNDIEIIGTNINNISIRWTFPFIYR